ncbi:MAG TPA: META domain-containing protein, partial [Caldilineae bacterium]|nr:META domain-containing protein [Caldilineae bacterium]
KILIVGVIIAALVGVYAVFSAVFGGSPEPPSPPPAATEAPPATVAPTQAPEQPTDPSEALEGRKWMLLGALPDAEITATFVRGKVAGSAGCNDYSGKYQTASDASIKISDLKGGRMACDQPIMDQELNFLSALESATSFLVQGDQMTLNTASGPLQFQTTD